MGNVRYKGDNYTRSSLSSGSNVVPNPEGEATETLNKIGIGDTVYNFEKENVIFTGAFDFSGQSATITLNNNKKSLTLALK